MKSGRRVAFERVLPPVLGKEIYVEFQKPAYPDPDAGFFDLNGRTGSMIVDYSRRQNKIVIARSARDAAILWDCFANARNDKPHATC